MAKLKLAPADGEPVRSRFSVRSFPMSPVRDPETLLVDRDWRAREGPWALLSLTGQA